MRIIFIVFSFAFCLTATAQQTDSRSLIIYLLNQGRYQEAFSKAMEVRKQPHGKNAVTDYFIAKSLCMEGYKEQSLTWLKHIDANYPLNLEQRSFIRSEMAYCSGHPSAESSGISTGPIAGSTYINYAPLPKADIIGKGGFTMDCYAKKESSMEGLKTIQELEKRVFTIREKKMALQKIRSIVSKGYSVDTTGRFILVSYKGHNLKTKDIRRVNEKLENAYAFFLKSYNLKPSDKMFTVYLVPDRRSLRETAYLVHGIKLPENSIGYSSVSDLSLLGIANPRSVGTLYHELFHLTIRTELGDIPAWLDEGIACMYAVYNQKENELFGALNTWRIIHFKSLTFLSEDHITVPSLEQLLSMNWEEFEGGKEHNTCVSSIHYSLANMFLLFLQEKELVYPTVETFKNRNFHDHDSLGAALSNVELVESVYGKKIGAISEEFYNWLEKTFNIKITTLINKHPYHNPNSVPTSAEFLSLNESIESLLQKIQNSKVLPESEFNKLNFRHSEMWSDYINNSERLNNYVLKDLTELTENITDEEIYESNKAKYYKEKLTETEEAFKELEKELIGILAASK